jgi:hypothetical protein
MEDALNGARGFEFILINFSGTEAGGSAGGPLTTVLRTVPRSSQSHRDERVLRQFYVSCFHPDGVATAVTGRGTIAVRTSSAGQT